jgi:alpha-D-ribose 1-methylphosphonate 5-triphosphate synthase subunit PhnI
MGYVAVRGGAEAIARAGELAEHERTRGDSAPLGVDQIRDQLRLAVDRIMGEGSLYAPDLAALAFQQAAGDTLEAAFMLRAYRATRPRLAYSVPVDTGRMRILRRISPAFKEIPGGQFLGATSDYSLRLLDFELLSDTEERREAFRRRLFDGAPARAVPDSLPKVIEILRRDGLLVERARGATPEPRFDLTRQSLTFPAPRAATLQGLARGETGGVLALAYSSLRGYGDIHPIIGELRVGLVPLEVPHPETGAPVLAGEVKVTETEVLARLSRGDERPRFGLGYGLCFGQNETKAIAMAILDRCIQAGTPGMPASNQEFVLSHVDGIEAMGFTNHFKLPHYVDFRSDLDRVRRAQQLERDGRGPGGSDEDR